MEVIIFCISPSIIIKLHSPTISFVSAFTFVSNTTPLELGYLNRTPMIVVAAALTPSVITKILTYGCTAVPYKHFIFHNTMLRFLVHQGY